MNKEIKQMLVLANTRVELSKHFSTVKQSIILDAIQNNEIEQLTIELGRPLNMMEQGMVLDYQMQWELVKGNLNEKKQKEINAKILVGIDVFKNNTTTEEITPSTEKEEILVLDTGASAEILNFEILEKISNLNFNIPVYHFIELLKERQYQIIEDIIERKLDTEELVQLHTIRKLLPA